MKSGDDYPTLGCYCYVPVVEYHVTHVLQVFCTLHSLFPPFLYDVIWPVSQEFLGCLFLPHMFAGLKIGVLTFNQVP